MGSLLLVTGCPRSGTGYAAKLFTYHGVPLGHEQFGPGGTSDWHLAGRPFMGEVLHQVRNPRDVIASLGTIGRRSVRYMSYRLDIGDSLDVSRLRDRCRLWLGWTALADIGADYVYRVEDAADEWLYLLRMVPTLEPWKGSRIATNVNSRRHDPVTWEQIADTAVYGEQVIARAREYGYRIEP